MKSARKSRFFSFLIPRNVMDGESLAVYGQGFDERLAAAVRLLRREEAYALTEDMFGYFERQGIVPEQRCVVIHGCAYSIVQVAAERNAAISDAKLLRLLARLPGAEDSGEDRKGFFCLLTHILSLLSEERRRHSRAYLYEIKAYLDKNYDKRVSLRQLAERVYVDAFYLGKEFRHQFGCSVSEYQNRLRIERAVALLTSPLRLHEIAVRVGYNSYNNFYHNFIRITGKKPEQMRKEAATGIS